MKTPPCRGVAAKSASCEQWIRAGPRTYVENLYFEHIAGRGAAYRDRPRADMDAETFARAASVDRCIDRTGTAPVHVLAFGCPVKDAFGARIVGHHPRPVVRRMLRQRLDRHSIAAVDLEYGLQIMRENAPWH